MSEQSEPDFDASIKQFEALMEVMREITDSKVPFHEPHELASRGTLRALQWQIDDHNALDDGELIDVLNQARVEIKYLCSIITDLKRRIATRETEIRALEHIEKYQASEISRLERLAAGNV
jgi:predicted RNA-binding protein with EMAP domain